MKVKILSVLFAASLTPSLALGQGLPAKSLGPEIRNQTVIYPMRNLVDTGLLQAVGCKSGGAASATCVGYKGAVAQQLMSGATSYTIEGSEIAAIGIPSKLRIILQDANSDDTLTCSSLILVGRDQFGLPISETVSSLTESIVYSSKVYGVLDKAIASGCVAGNDSNDRILIMGSWKVGLPLKIGAESGVVSICRVTVDSTSALVTNQRCWKPGSADSIVEFDNAGTSSRVDVANNALDLATALTIENGGSTTTSSISKNMSYVVRLRIPNGSY